MRRLDRDLPVVLPLGSPQAAHHGTPRRHLDRDRHQNHRAAVHFLRLPERRFQGTGRIDLSHAQLHVVAFGPFDRDLSLNFRSDVAFDDIQPEHVAMGIEFSAPDDADVADHRAAKRNLDLFQVRPVRFEPDRLENGPQRQAGFRPSP